MTSLRIRH